MQLVTLPHWFWILYYLFLLVTVGTAIYSIVKRGTIMLSFVTIMFAITIPMISLINSIGRAEGMNELEHLVSQLQHGAIWAIFTTIGYLFMLIWWALFLFESKKKNKIICIK